MYHHSTAMRKWNKVRCLSSNSDLLSINNWASDNGLLLNSRKSSTIVRSNPRHHRGSTLTANLARDEHMSSVCARVAFTLKRFQTVAGFLLRETWIRVVVALVVPHFLYGSEIYTECSRSCMHISWRFRSVPLLDSYTIKEDRKECHLWFLQLLAPVWFHISSDAIWSQCTSLIHWEFHRIWRGNWFWENLEGLIKSMFLECLLDIWVLLLWNSLPLALRNFNLIADGLFGFA